MLSHILKKGIKKNAQTGYEVIEEKNGTTIIVFSQDLDKAIAALIIANGAKSMGKNVFVFFIFLGLNIFRKSKRIKVKKSFIEKIFGKMMPKGVDKLTISNMNMFGMGSKKIKGIMKKKNVDSLQKLILSANDMDVMGIKEEELIDNVEITCVATYLGDTQESNHNLFI